VVSNAAKVLSMLDIKQMLGAKCRQ
jgi:hypothetical protein